MNIYHYHPFTGAFLFESEADESPLEPGIYLVPDHATEIEPPETGLNQAAVFDTIGWSIADDYRGTLYYLPDGSRHIINELGVAPPLESSAEPPPKTLSQLRAEMQSEAWKVLRALTQMGLREAVEAAVAAADQDTKDMFYRTTLFHRTSPFVASVAVLLNKTDAEIDALFELANTFTQ